MNRLSDEPWNILQSCRQLYREAGVPHRLVERDEEADYGSLLVGFEDVGRTGRSIQAEITFVPGLPSAAEGIHIVQIFVPTLAVDFVDVIPQDLYRFLNRLNVNVPIGSFGIMEEDRLVYFKATSIVDVRQRAEWNARQIDRCNGLLLHTHDLFLDAIEDVATGALSFEEAAARASLY